MSEPGPIGERVRALRQNRYPRMTQRELADAAGISVDVISKLEQGSKQTALLVTLHQIARALDVNVSDLLGADQRIDQDSSTGDAGVIAIRRALLARSAADGPAVPDGDLDRSVNFAWGAYWHGRYDTLGATLPELITQARTSNRLSGTPRSAVRLADSYGVTASTLVHLGELDLAYLAMDRALSTAEHGDDPLYRAALNGWMSWLLLHQTGTLDEAYAVAVTAAGDLRGNDDPRALSVWGSLLLSAGVAAARIEDVDAADAFLREARSAAERLLNLGFPIRRDYESSFGVAQVVMQSVDVAVVTDRPGRALDLARAFPPDADLPIASRARHLADRAYALAALDKDEEALDVLLTIEHLAPQWIRFQTYPRSVIRELVERERRARTPRLRGLAERLGLVA